MAEATELRLVLHTLSWTISAHKQQRKWLRKARSQGFPTSLHSTLYCTMHRLLAPNEALRALFAYCQGRDWAGHDPYDALNSRVFDVVPGANTRIPRLVMTQLLKRSPVNFRGLLRIQPTQNPKALALMLTASLKLDGSGVIDTQTLRSYFIDRICALRSTGTDDWCWGYSFPWQTRTLMVPRGAPNLVCTTFVANALMDAWERDHDPRLLEMVWSAAQYIVRDLYFEDPRGSASFAYPRSDMKSKIHNANLLAAALLIRVQAQRPDEPMLARALAAARFSASRQRPDGSWPYGDAPSQQWIDNFHTGYNLSALRSIGRTLGSNEFEEHVHKGFAFYRTHFVREDGAPRYFHDNTYPIDIHCAAQTILTLLEFTDLDASGPQRARQVYDWSMGHMWDRRGFFYYRVLPFLKIRISYMRWSQAWMLLAIATMVEQRQASDAKANVPRVKHAS